jgi:hypothetical protein
LLWKAEREQLLRRQPGLLTTVSVLGTRTEYPDHPMKRDIAIDIELSTNCVGKLRVFAVNG